MAQRKITTEKLGQMIKEGWNHTATKDDITGVNARLDRIEHLLMEEQKRTIEDLEQRMKRLEDVLAV